MLVDLLAFFSMFGAYQKWCRSTSTRAQYHQKMLDMSGLSEDSDSPRAGKQRELERAEIQKSEDAVQRTILVIQNFTNPFTNPDKNYLYNLASGAPSLPDVEYERIGKEAKECFIRERFVTAQSETKFFEPNKKQNLKTMAYCSKVLKLSTTQGRVT